MVIFHHHSKSYLVYFLLSENIVCKVHLNKELKDERDISLIKILALSVAMRFIDYRHEYSVKIMYRPHRDYIVLNGLFDQLRFYTSMLLPRSTPKSTSNCYAYMLEVLLVFASVKIVYIDDSYRPNTK